MITIKEIAELAGVTPTTVSNVIHGKRNKVSAATVERIQAILKETNYIPRLGLNALQNRGSGIIGILVNTPDYAEGSSYELPFYSSIIGTLENLFRPKGYYTMIISSKDVEEIAKMAMGWNVEGIIAVSMPESIVDFIEQNIKKPVVAIDLDETDERLIQKHAGVMSKDYKGGRIMAEYLLNCGVQEIIYVSNTKRGADYRRFQGVRDYYREVKGPSERMQMIQLPSKWKKRIEIYESFRKDTKRNKALFFSSDLNAVEALQYFAGHNVKVPEDISVVGFDNNIFAKLSIPGLTTIQCEGKDKAELAAKILLNMIEKKEDMPSFVETEVSLVERDSVKVQLGENYYRNKL